MRSGKELLIASRQYASEQRWKSWWHFLSTLTLALAFLVVACLDLPLGICVVSSILASLVMIRLFIIYHDFMHGTILSGSVVAGGVLKLFGTLVLSPPHIWKHSHDEHHKNNARHFGPVLGTFPVMSTADYAKASTGERFYYALSRHPVTFLLAYFTVFFWDMCLHAFLINPKKHFDGGVAIVLHVSLAVALSFISFQALILGLLMPMAIITCLGSYLFYAQHNFPGMIRHEGSEWDHVHAALQSSSFMQMGSVMHWFTGNIGYHHVHHLNAKIPFYRLPEAMAGIEELQSPTVTTLHPSDVIQCLRLKLWDPVANRLMTFSEAAELA
ncbi:Fatty acid desaturase [Planctomycetes bacterium K23_9]|uniref:Fatty acid desaturase n=2 Tax=Stieleria marina TaxID=1930275 RepID=A0A517NRL9_9BACT|nr:Fatty acid desaturase [Planctomycetes bacterium K23_9]